MSILHPRYEQLCPDIKLLSDQAVLTQAWKKSDSYIRRHNWYADVLELEQTTVRLPELIPAWSQEVLSGKVTPASMRLVPAPKNAKWAFPDKEGSKGWRFSPPSGQANKGKRSPLRPLAHLTIRDQTLATAAMLCLADGIETLQGNTNQINYQAAQRHRVYSYGNRLFCNWITLSDSREQARFRWGNANTYSQFFTDYQRFLERPAEVCRDHVGQRANERLYVVKLDLSKFYDCIDCSALQRNLKLDYQEYAEKFDVKYDNSAAKPFWSCVKRILKWQWDAPARKLSKLFDEEKPLADGLPQGLVASGFFANAYLHQFDQKIGAQIDKIITPLAEEFLDAPNEQWVIGARILDYCRYVDDLRLVVAVPEDGSEVRREDTLRTLVTDWITRELNSHCQSLDATKGLKIGEEKTEIIAWEDFAAQGRISQYIKGVQGQISVVPDATTLRQTTGNLDHLLWLADSLEENAEIKHNKLLLSRISTPRMDVRDDTIKRFAANRLRKVLRMRRSMASPDALPPGGDLTSPGISELRATDHEMESAARKLLACWARNPALVTVLRCGLDLCPSPELLTPVLQALLTKITAKKSQRNEREVALYVAGDLLKAGAVETGWRKPEDYPEHADIPGYRLELKKLALELLERKNVPWFVAQQAALFLAVMQHAADSLPGMRKLKEYATLHAALHFAIPNRVNSDEALTSALIAQQLTRDIDGFAIWFGRQLSKGNAKSRKSLIEQLLLAAPHLLQATATAFAVDKPEWLADFPPFLPPRLFEHPQSIEHLNNSNVSLSSLARHPENPFVQETALLKLAELLLERNSATLQSSNLCLTSILVKCTDWTKIQDPTTHGLTLEIGTSALPRRLKTCPDWCMEEYAWAYTLGRILRSAIIGEDDYTTRYYPAREIDLDAYRGIRSTWFKRRMGLAPISAGIGIEPTPLSPWFSELILRLLQWPGLEINRDLVSGFSEVRKPSDLLLIIRSRLKELGKLYGKLSKLPVYLLPNEAPDKSDPAHFRVAIVQTLLPNDSDFCAQDPTSWTTTFRNRHRAHLAAMCHLVDQQLIATQSALPEASRPKKPLDLIVFPELSVHPEDMWLLVSLSDRTGAAIFAGQTFVTHPYLNKPINRAVWLLRQSLHTGRQIVKVFQGKQHPTTWERKNGVQGHRPYQVVIQFQLANGKQVNLTGAICYDATDLRLAADLREISDGFVIAALNQDVGTFDTMTSALQYHMFQPVILANTGQYGGSTAQAPYKEPYHRLIAHTHGNNQAAVSLFEINLVAFKEGKTVAPAKELKTPPAGYKGRE